MISIFVGNVRFGFVSHSGRNPPDLRLNVFKYHTGVFNVIRFSSILLKFKKIGNYFDERRSFNTARASFRAPVANGKPTNGRLEFSHRRAT